MNGEVIEWVVMITILIMWNGFLIYKMKKDDR